MTDDPLSPPAHRIRVVRGDDSFMAGAEKEPEPEDSDDDEDEGSDD